jgi:hypothetical protein
MGRWTWRRLERDAVRGHTRDLQHHLRELADRRPAVLDTDASWVTGIMSLQLSGHRLVLGGVAASTAWDVLAMTLSPTRLELTKAGRYGPFWWIAIGGEAERVVLATHLQLRHDPGREREAERNLPVLSGAS